jgi:branched-chain amino acid aminotransferase
VVVLVRTAPIERSGRPASLRTVAKPRAGEHKDPGVKSGNYLAHVLALAEARRAGATDCLFVNEEGHITEASTANAWFVFGDEVVTPPVADGLLPGVTRALLLEALRDAGIPHAERSVTPEAARTANEAFLTGTMRDVAPVLAIDDHSLDRGPWTLRVEEAWRARCAAQVTADRAALDDLIG